MALPAGVRLGVYEVLGLVGAGGMGEVYRARDTILKRDVAIKVLPSYVSQDPDRLRRFEQEAQATAALNHPNILAIYQFGDFEGAPYLVSELLEGETLREMLKRGPVPVRKAIDYGVQIANGLAAAHEKRIVHRDLKPENLFVSRDGRVKILDFGLAKLKRSPAEVGTNAPTQSVGSTPGAVIGTVGYMSPEQVRGGEIDHRCDIFAFGATVYEMFSGKRAFQRATLAETMTAILNEDPPAISLVSQDAPPGIQRVVNRCLEKNPEQRFQSASDLAFALETISDSGVHSGFGAAGQPKSHLPWRWFGATALGLVVVAGFVMWWRTPAPAPTIDSVVQLTNDGEQKPLSNIVTDGSRVYFTEGQPGSQSLAQVSVNGGPTALIETKLVNPKIAALAPDGSSLLVFSGGWSIVTDTMWSVPLPAGEPRQLGNEGMQDAAYFPDGRMVYFRDNTLYSADADGSEPRRIASLDKVRGTPWRPGVSPDGKRIVFSMFLNGTNNNNSVFEIGSDGRDFREIATPAPDDSQCCAVWMPDGKFIVTTAGRGISGDIWMQPAKPGISVLPRPMQPSRLTNGELSYRFAIVRPSRDGKQIFAVGTKWRGELVRYDIPSKSFVPFLSGIAATDVTFSRDGRWVSYLSYPDHALWRSRADGTDRMQLTYPPMEVIFPCISPDGTKVVFGNGQAEMHIVSMEGGPLQRVGDKGIYPTWSPDGNKLAFGVTTATSTGHANTFELRTFDLRTGKTSVIPTQAQMMGAFWVTQDTLVAANNDSTKFRTFDLQTGRWSDLISGSFVNWFVSPDGEYLYYTTSGSDSKVMRLRFADHHVETIVPNLKDLRRVVDPVALTAQINVAPDGSPIFTRDTGSQELYALKLRWR